eukprot:Skav208114  [mRNA]  locus=scaffold2016:49566:50477:+ [translate_table: standard]
MNVALRLGLHLAASLVLALSEEQADTCSDQATSQAVTSAALLQAGANRTGKADGTEQHSNEEHDEVATDEELEDDEAEEHREEIEDVLDHEESLLKRAHARHAAELELESAIAGKSRRRRSRRRTTTTTTTVDCGSTMESYSIGWVTGGTDWCVEGLNTGAATEQIDSSKCTESTRDKWMFTDNGNGYCTLVAQYNDGHRRRNHKGTSVTCGTSSKSVAYCKVNGNQGYTKLKLEDLGNNKFSMWWYDSSGTARKAYRASGNGGIIIADVSNGDDPQFRVYKNAVYSSTCRLAKSDLGVSCWK